MARLAEQSGDRGRRPSVLADCRSAPARGYSSLALLHFGASPRDRHDDEEPRSASSSPARVVDCSRCSSPAAPRRRRATRRAPRAGARAGAGARAAAPRRAAPPLVAAPFADAVARAGERLLQDAQATLGSGPRELVIDPLIDASTGQQTNGTVQMGAAARRPDHAPRADLERAAADARRSLRQPAAAPDRHADRDQHQERARTRTPTRSASASRSSTCAPASSSPSASTARRSRRSTPSRRALFRDSPTWALDRDGARLHQVVPGQRARRPDRARLPAAPAGGGGDQRGACSPSPTTSRPTPTACIARRAPSPTPTTCASSTASTRRAGRPAARRKRPRPSARSSASASSEEAADQAVLQPGHDDAAAVGRPAGAVRGLAAARSRPRSARARAACASSATPAAPATPPPTRCCRRSAPRSSRRASSGRTSKLAPRITADGVGSREMIVGLGTDDLRDALDRRVEFRTVDCR